MLNFDNAPQYEIWGGHADSLSFYDGGPASFFEDCDTLDTARKSLAELRESDYNLVVWIKNKETGEVVADN